MDSILTVTSPAGSYNLTTIEAVMDELGGASRANGGTLTRWLAAYSARFATACNRVLVSEAVSETFTLDRVRRGGARPLPLSLARWPVSAVARVTEDGATLNADTDYQLDGERGRLFRLDGSGCRREWTAEDVVVAYTGGYTTIPADIQDAVITLIRHRWFGAGRDPALKSQAIDGVSTEQFWIGAVGDVGDLPPEVAAVVDRHREISV